MKFRFVIMVLFLGVFSAMLPVRQAQAQVCGGGCCSCIEIRNFIKGEIGRHETWLVDTFWAKKLEPALGTMANTINAGLVTQTTQMGTFLEGQNNIEKRRTLQELTAESAKSYVPSEQLCRFGSLGQSLGASEEKARANRLAMIERSLSRQLGQADGSDNVGNSDIVKRTKNVVTRYCAPTDNNGQNKALCQATDSRFYNADINFAATYDSKPTLDIDFTAGKTVATDDEKDINALADNIFASDLFSRPKAGDLGGGTGINDARLSVMDMRALVAKRSVAENSFNTLVSQKARGSGMDSSGGPLGSTSYITNVLKELKMDPKDVEAYLGKAPSYDSQMEVLTKKIYQTPSFYINLMENPAGVERQYAAMQSFGLMQQRDIFDSIMRSEMLLSLIVELEVAKYQDDAQALMDR